MDSSFILKFRTLSKKMRDEDLRIADFADTRRLFVQEIGVCEEGVTGADTGEYDVASPRKVFVSVSGGDCGFYNF